MALRPNLLLTVYMNTLYVATSDYKRKIYPLIFDNILRKRNLYTTSSGELHKSISGAIVPSFLLFTVQSAVSLHTPPGNNVKFSNV